jgi:hypothetical protein
MLGEGPAVPAQAGLRRTDIEGMTRIARLLPCLLAALLLAGCEPLGIPDPAKEAAAKEAEARAIGSACRHALRAIEDCYTLNPRANKAGVFAGWREMDEYMRENKLDGVAPVVPRPEPRRPRRAGDEDEPAAESSKASG